MATCEEECPADEPTHYEVLGVDERASRAQIKAAYQRMVLLHHPDKANSGSCDGAESSEFQRVQLAWTVLRDKGARKDYDRTRYEDELSSRISVAEVVDLDDMTEEEDHYWHPCRCGEQYRIYDQQLEAGVEIVQCSGCSFRIQVIYVAEED